MHRVAVVGGSGSDCHSAAAAAGVDVVLTSDLKHHVTLDFLATGGPAVIDVAHFASEWPWVPAVADLLARDLDGLGLDVQIATSTILTDPWTFRA